MPRSPRSVYDVRDVIRDVVDEGRLLELSPHWARNLVTGFARVGGRAVGVVANQPRRLGGVLDVQGSEKGTRFVQACARFGIALLVFVDTPGFMPGLRQESAGIIRHGAQLVRAFAAALVPRITVVLRKAYGGAYITMNAKDLGADLALAWSGAEIGVMGSHAAVSIIHRRQIESSPDGRTVERLAQDYAARHIAVERALELRLIDAVIEPSETRRYVIEGLRGP